MKDMKNSLRPKKRTKKQDFCVENSEKRVASPNLPSILMGKDRWLYGVKPPFLQDARTLWAFLKKVHSFEVEELDLQAKTS